MKTIIKYLLILISISANAQLEQKTTNYSYDNLNRLVQVVFNDNSEHNYVYDDIGNRIQLNIETLSINEEILKNPIIVYPNPTDSFLNIKLPDSFVSKNTSIQLYDVNGRLIQNNNPTILNNQIKVNVNNLSNGLYILYLKTDNQTWSKLFIKK